MKKIPLDAVKVASLISDLAAIQAIKIDISQVKENQSPILLDLKIILSFPQILKKAIDLFEEKMKGLSFHLICGIPYAGLIFASNLSIRCNQSLVLKRKENKALGSSSEIEGIFKGGKTCVVLSDALSSGTEMLDTVDSLNENGLQVRDCLVLIEDDPSGKKRVKERGLLVHPLFSYSEIIQALFDAGKLDGASFKCLSDCLESV